MWPFSTNLPSSKDKLALVTGASSGIGKSLARYHAQRGGHLIIAARRQDKLQELKKELEADYKIKCVIITADLSSYEGARKLYDDVKAQQLEIDYLINNAGFGGHGTVLDRPVEDDIKMIMTNCVALVTLTDLFARDMKERGVQGAKILNVGSTAGFMPGPNQAVYFATKAFVASFSQAVDQECRKYGITSTVLCPGYIHTEFADVAKLEGTDVTKQVGMQPDEVAKIGYDAMMREELVVINETKLSVLLNWVVPLMPRRAVLQMGENMQQKH